MEFQINKEITPIFTCPIYLQVDVYVSWGFVTLMEPAYWTLMNVQQLVLMYVWLTIRCASTHLADPNLNVWVSDDQSYNIKGI